MSEGTEKNNVYDFTAYRIAKRAEALYAEGQPDQAHILWEALEAYVQGLCEVQFIDGKTYIREATTDDGEGNEK